MKELIPKDEYGIFADAHDTVRVDSPHIQTHKARNSRATA